MIYAFIVDRCADLPVEQCLATMKVSRSAFYAWRHAQAYPTPRMLDDADLGDLIVKVHQSLGTYGSRRVTAELRLGLGRQVNHERVERLMRERGLQGVIRRRRAKGCTREPGGRSSPIRPDGPGHKNSLAEATARPQT